MLCWLTVLEVGALSCLPRQRFIVSDDCPSCRRIVQNPKSLAFFFLIIFILRVWMFCLHVCLSTTCVPAICRGQKRCGSPGTRIADNYDPLCKCWEANWVFCKSSQCFYPLSYFSIYLLNIYSLLSFSSPPLHLSLPFPPLPSSPSLSVQEMAPSLLPHGSQGLNSSCQCWQPGPLPVERLSTDKLIIDVSETGPGYHSPRWS